MDLIMDSPVTRVPERENIPEIAQPEGILEFPSNIVAVAPL
jgi:hypothetical protein